MAKKEKSKTIEDEELFKEQKTYNQIQKLEKIYNEGQFDIVLNEIDQKKQELVKEMIEYAKKHERDCKWSKDGDVLDTKVELNPLVINNKFFKPITPIGCQEPMYNAEKLSMVYDYYCEILAEINENIGYYPSSLTNFCKLAGITLYTLKTYRSSNDLNMRIIVEKIYDQIGDENITMSQLGVVKERTTMFKLKSQNEIVEKVTPNVNINVQTIDVDIDRINKRLNKYKQFAKKKGQ